MLTKYLFTNITQTLGIQMIVWSNHGKEKIDMKFGTWIVRSQYRAGVLSSMTNEVNQYRMDLAGVQGVR